MTTSTTVVQQLDRKAFDQAYDRVVIGNHFFEAPSYYHQQRPRYRRTLEHVARLGLPQGSQVLEIGGGQIALLASELLGLSGTVADVNPGYSDAVTKFGLRFVECDLIHDDLPERDYYDLVVLCEVIEHLAIPPYLILEKIRHWIKPGGYLLVTTPNLYRLRNGVRMLTGKTIFCHFRYPEKGQWLQHPLEYSDEHLRWQLEQAGYQVLYVQRQQLANAGATLRTKIERFLAAPLLKLVPLWRDSLVAIGKK